MSALLSSPHLTLEVLTEQQFIDPLRTCRFCKCHPEKPCVIPVRLDDVDGNFYLVRSEAEATEVVACCWFLPGICNAPECMEKLQRELRDEAPGILDQWGKRA